MLKNLKVIIIVHNLILWENKLIILKNQYSITHSIQNSFERNNNKRDGLERALWVGPLGWTGSANYVSWFSQRWLEKRREHKEKGHCFWLFSGKNHPLFFTGTSWVPPPIPTYGIKALKQLLVVVNLQAIFAFKLKKL